MPIYGYACTHCGHTLDALQKIADEPLVNCPECNTPKLKRQLSAPRFRLKGKGWYETDFKSEKQRNLAGDKAADVKTDAKPGDKAESGADDKKKKESKVTDTKVEKKTESKPASGTESAA